VYASCFHPLYKTRDRQADVRSFQVFEIGSFLRGRSLRSKLVALGVTNAIFFLGGLERPDSFGLFFRTVAHRQNDSLLKLQNLSVCV
jgi:hypothetical protein